MIRKNGISTLIRSLRTGVSLIKAECVEVIELTMGKDLIDGARGLFADELFETVRRCYCEANKGYLDRQMKIASEYLTDEQKEELRQRGVMI